MNGLRIYIRTVVSQADGEASAFYSRKSGGPVYQWIYDDKQAVWRCSRVSSSEITAQAFDLTTWKSLPSSLQVRLAEHYIE